MPHDPVPLMIVLAALMLGVLVLALMRWASRRVRHDALLRGRDWR